MPFTPVEEAIVVSWKDTPGNRWGPPVQFHNEENFQRAVIRLAQRLGWRVWWCARPEGSPPGWPDLTLWRDRMVFAELKSTVGKLTEEQGDTLYGLYRAGAEVHVRRPAHLSGGLIRSILASPALPSVDIIGPSGNLSRSLFLALTDPAA